MTPNELMATETGEARPAATRSGSAIAAAWVEAGALALLAALAGAWFPTAAGDVQTIGARVVMTLIFSELFVAHAAVTITRLRDRHAKPAVVALTALLYVPIVVVIVWLFNQGESWVFFLLAFQALRTWAHVLRRETPMRAYMRMLLGIIGPGIVAIAITGGGSTENWDMMAPMPTEVAPLFAILGTGYFAVVAIFALPPFIALLDKRRRRRRPSTESESTVQQPDGQDREGLR